MHFSFIGKAQFRRATLSCDSFYCLFCFILEAVHGVSVAFPFGVLGIWLYQFLTSAFSPTLRCGIRIVLDTEFIWFVSESCRRHIATRTCHSPGGETKLRIDGKGKMSLVMTKPTKWSVGPKKTLTSFCIHSVRSESLLCTQWVAKVRRLLHADSEAWSDGADAQADLSLRCVHKSFCCVCHAPAQIFSECWTSKIW